MPKHILVVDDDPEILELTTGLLLKHGFEVSTAKNGLIALDEIDHRKPDLILADVLMPEMDGYVFYKELKSNPLNEDIPVLILTGREKMEDSFKVLGVDGFISKPFSPDKLIEEINHILHIAQNKEDLTDESGVLITKKIFAVCTYRTILDDMVHQAQRSGYEIETAVSGANAISKAITFLPDMFFIDVHLDDLSSVDLVKTLKALPQFESTPIIGFCYYPVDNLGDTELRKKILKNKDMSEEMLRCGATQYMGRYNHQLFVKTFIAYLKEGNS